MKTKTDDILFHIVGVSSILCFILSTICLYDVSPIHAGEGQKWLGFATMSVCSGVFSISYFAVLAKDLK